MRVCSFNVSCLIGFRQIREPINFPISRFGVEVVAPVPLRAAEEDSREAEEAVLPPRRRGNRQGRPEGMISLELAPSRAC